jgi:hypothetical protein
MVGAVERESIAAPERNQCNLALIHPRFIALCSHVSGRLAERLPEDYLPQGGPRMNVVVVIMDSFPRITSVPTRADG